ncbi:MAG: ATP-binding protein [Gemmiger sp.]|uniref:ATP-binding protein n=1 Tax=Gemmiger sp. TaxID=2049027 RepID=UPI00300ECD43
MFIGREKELTLLQQDYIGKAVMVYGKRRVGKTTLIQKALENCQHQTVYYECSKGAMQDNIDGLVRELARVKMLPVPLNFSTLQDVFIYLNALPKKIVVVIDEYPYLKKATDSATVDSIFQNIIDNRLSNIELVLSGSHIGMMKDLLQERNALYGRFAVTIKLNELNYLDAARFYPDRTPYDKVAHYAVFGGSPFVNQALNPAATLRENVISTILNPVSAVYLYASQLLLSDYSVKINAERIFSVIGNGKKRYTEIEDKLDVKKTGNLSKQIKSLTELEIVSRNSPINKIGDNKKATFEINDNLLRFYFTFIYKNASALQVLGAEAFYDEYVAPTLTDFISRRFEGICRDYFSLQVRSGKLKGVRNIGSYYYDDPVHRKNGEFDVTLELADGYAIYEAKYYVQPMTLDEIRREAQQVANIKELVVKQLGFIAINGFVEQEKPYTYLDGNDIFAGM